MINRIRLLNHRLIIERPDNSLLLSSPFLSFLSFLPSFLPPLWLTTLINPELCKRYRTLDAFESTVETRERERERERRRGEASSREKYNWEGGIPVAGNELKFKTARAPSREISRVSFETSKWRGHRCCFFHKSPRADSFRAWMIQRVEWWMMNYYTEENP